MTSQLVRLVLGIALCVCTALAAHAEVAFTPTRGTIILGTITEDPNPIGVWLQYRSLPSNQVLNADGHARGDGRPDVVWRDDGRPIVTWSYNAGGDYDVVLSEWDGTKWEAPNFLTSSTNDELDPRVFFASDGTVHVVWWTLEPSEEIYISTRQPGSSTWEPPALVTAGAETRRRPSVAVFDGTLAVAFERDSTTPGIAQDIVVATRQPGGEFVIEVIGGTVRTERLDVMLHAELDHV